MDKAYIAIDLKSFYASVECVERGLDPLNTNMVVADISRTEKTICLAVTPALKAYGIPGRARLFEVVQRVKEINEYRITRTKEGIFTGKSFLRNELESNPELELDYIVARPRMATYMEYSTRIYQLYTKYVAPEDMHVYSIDEVFMDATEYIRTRNISARDFAKLIVADVLKETGITATVGIGSNLYLSKIAMDIIAKRAEPDGNGLRIGELDEAEYRSKLWNHEPLTDFWRVGKGYAQKLQKVGLRTMGDVARCSIGGIDEYYNEELLYKLFGVNAQLLIDHAWGWEPCTIKDIKAYQPESNSISMGQVLQCPYDYDSGKMIVREMTESLVLDLVDKGLVTNQMILTVGYDKDNQETTYIGEMKTDVYGRSIPKSGHGTGNLERYTSSTKLIMNAVMEIYERVVDRGLMVRRIYVVAANVRPGSVEESTAPQQLDLFGDWEENRDESQELQREKRMQQTMLDIKKKYGKNAILHGTSYQEGATARDRNRQIGGHRA
jgi:DNA polymerase V